MTYAAPLARWSMDDLSGTTMTDVSGNGRDGLYAGSPVLGVPGQIGTAVEFGYGRFGRIPEASWMRVSAAMTVAVWIKCSTTAAGNTIISRFDNSSASQQPWILDTSGGTARFLMKGASGTRYDAVDSSASSNDGNWHRIVGTYDGTAVRVYKDGVQVGSAAYAGTISNPAMDMGILVATREFGSTDNSNANYFPGVIDDVVFDDTAWTLAQIEEDYAGSAAAITGDLAAPLPLLVVSATGTVLPPPVDGSLASSLPALTTDLAGVVLPPPVTGDLTAALPAIGFAGTGGSSAADIDGSLGATFPALTVNLTGATAPVGLLATALPALTTSLSGLVAAPGAVAGVLSAQLPAIEALFGGRSATPTTDTFNRSNGRNRSGSGWANQDEPVAALPATLTREPIRVMAQTLPTPTLEKGRPV